mgnify:CR=1 FL=1
MSDQDIGSRGEPLFWSFFYGEEVMELLETEEEIEWSYKRNSPYNHHVILHHIPSGHE